MSVIKDRMTAVADEKPVIFLIGMRFNKPWKIHKWLPMVIAFPRMMRELEANPSLGFLGAHSWFGLTTISVQYWRSFEDLEAYAKNRDRAHLPAWAAFNKAVGKSGDIGVWHESYRSGEGNYETIYANMPPFGLGKAFKAVSVSGKGQSAAGRMNVKKSDGANSSPPADVN